MILTFQSRFVPLIQAGTKIHTLRADNSGRWKAGRVIHFYKGNPRNGGFQFPWSAFAPSYEGRCIATESILLRVSHGDARIIVDDTLLNLEQMNLLAFQDGFNSIRQLFAFFFGDDWQELELASWTGKIIHWTDFRYAPQPQAL